MSTPPEPGFLDALAALRIGLDETGAPSMIIGGVAVIALGVPRLTIDIDATVAAANLPVERVADALGRHDINPRTPDAVAFAREHHVYLAVHAPSGTPVDVTFALLPFEEAALAASQPCDYSGVSIRVPRPDDLIIYKLIAARPQDVDDAEGLLALHGRTIDVKRIRSVIGEFAMLLGDAERPRTLERLIEKIGLGPG